MPLASSCWYTGCGDSTLTYPTGSVNTSKQQQQHATATSCHATCMTTVTPHVLACENTLAHMSQWHTLIRNSSSTSCIATLHTEETIALAAAAAASGYITGYMVQRNVLAMLHPASNARIITCTVSTHHATQPCADRYGACKPLPKPNPHRGSAACNGRNPQRNQGSSSGSCEAGSAWLDPVSPLQLGGQVGVGEVLESK
jgi:hypothetical protein